ncbi:PASTA domain-containing protein [Flavobacterium sp. '19STA2R22 D10 B1']|uniref:PASTA domain-containing protein n=1 Tax=Flavobacterium aerium TaxID=3037261 RepID=UPI00278C2087|nr:PASTA domain-containing protein [Flavobacterium sp. '19STA2R22 D10 B1']
MSLSKFLTSRVFVKQLIIAAVIVFIATFLLMKWLSVTTNHGEEITVPDLKKMTATQIESKLENMDLEYVIVDSVDYRSDFPKFSVVDQDPIAGAKVKQNRKIYVKLNSSGYAQVKIPDLIQRTYRQALPTLKALGLDEGKIIYVPNIAKDMVLEMRFNGKKLKPGDQVLKTSKIDLVLGDGKIGFEDNNTNDTDGVNIDTKNEQ